MGWLKPSRVEAKLKLELWVEICLQILKHTLLRQVMVIWKAKIQACHFQLPFPKISAALVG